jgi:hypothetical protein
MRNRLIFLAGVGVGYVLGARAGRERYEQIARTARKIKENPTVQETAGVIQAQTAGIVTTAKETVTDKLGHTAWGSKVSNFLSTEERRSEPAHTPAGSNGLPTIPPRPEA